jgi:hypothetical protein
MCGRIFRIAIYLNCVCTWLCIRDFQAATFHKYCNKNVTNFSISSRSSPKRSRKTWEVNICDKHKIRLILMSSSRRRANGKIESMNKISLKRGSSASIRKIYAINSVELFKCKLSKKNVRYGICRFEIEICVARETVNIQSIVCLSIYTPGFLNDWQPLQTKRFSFSSSKKNKELLKWCLFSVWDGRRGENNRCHTNELVSRYHRSSQYASLR